MSKTCVTPSEIVEFFKSAKDLRLDAQFDAVISDGNDDVVVRHTHGRLFWLRSLSAMSTRITLDYCDAAGCFIGTGHLSNPQTPRGMLTAYVSISEDVLTLEWFAHATKDGTLCENKKMQFTRKKGAAAATTIQKALEEYLAIESEMPTDRQVLIKLVLETFKPKTTISSPMPTTK
jgi:hypothetical protein